MTAPGVAGVLLLIRLLGWMQVLEWMAFDQFFRWRPPEPADPRVVIVGVTEQDLNQLQRWPTDDATLATAIAQIQAQQPRAIGLDLYRNFPIDPGYADLEQLYKRSPNLIGITKKGGSNQQGRVDPPAVLQNLGQVAANDVMIDGDGKIRRGLLYWTSEDGDALESLGFRLALIYLAAKGIQPQPGSTASNPPLKLGNAVFPFVEPNDGSYVNADAGGYQMILNWRGPAGSFHTVSLTDVLQGRVPAETFRDRVVLLGTTAESLKDLFYTPYSGTSITTPEKMAGVEIQATIASQVISAALTNRPLIQVWSDWAELSWIVGWSTVGAVVAWILRAPEKSIIALSLLEGTLIVGAYLAFLQGWWIPVAPAAIAVASSAIAITGYIASVERRDRQTIMTLFGKHVTPKIADIIWHDRHRLISKGRLMGRKMTATVLFSDLQDFSSIAEQLDPESLMSWLNECMDAMSKLVLSHDGVVDKFIGDAVMAVFGVPIAHTNREEIAQDVQNAILCAIEMGKTLQELNRKWQAQGRPTTAMRIGISTGTVITGSLGGQQRLDYTTLGDSVNVAARLESYDKSVGTGICRILISEDTYRYIQGQFATQFIGTVQLKGRQQPTNIYQVLLESQSLDS